MLTISMRTGLGSDYTYYSMFRILEPRKGALAGGRLSSSLSRCSTYMEWICGWKWEGQGADGQGVLQFLIFLVFTSQQPGEDPESCGPSGDGPGKRTLVISQVSTSRLHRFGHCHLLETRNVGDIFSRTGDRPRTTWNVCSCILHTFPFWPAPG